MPQESTRTVDRRMTYILDGLSFPAARWQILTHAEFYGADALSIAHIRGMPARSYEDIDAVVLGIFAGLPDDSAVLRTTPARSRDVRLGRRPIRRKAAPMRHTVPDVA